MVCKYVNVIDSSNLCSESSQQVNLATAEELSRGVSGVMGDLSPAGEIIWSFLCGSRQTYGGPMYFRETVRNSPCPATAEPQCCLVCHL